MTVIHKNKKGFTLLEMMLSIAIVTIVSGCLVTLIIAIKDAYINTYNSDDSADYAMLFAQGFENSFLAAVQDHEGHPAKNASWKVTSVGGHDTLVMNTTPVFTMSMMTVQQKTTNSRVDKWRITMEFSFNSSTNMVNYTIKVTDNYYNPGHLKCVYNGGFMVPHFNNGTISCPSANEIVFKAS